MKLNEKQHKWAIKCSVVGLLLALYYPTAHSNAGFYNFFSGNYAILFLSTEKLGTQNVCYNILFIEYIALFFTFVIGCLCFKDVKNKI